MSSPQDYVGPVGHEKKFHKTHFPVLRELKGRKYKSLRDDPDYEEYKPGVFRLKKDVKKARKENS